MRFMKVALGGLIAIGGALAISQGVTLGQGDSSATVPYEFDLKPPKFIAQKQDWLNTNGKPIEFERGKVYVVEYWTFG